MKLLLIDEDLDIRQQVAKHFADYDVDLVAVADTATARRVSSGLVLDLIVLDLTSASRCKLDVVIKTLRDFKLPVIVTNRYHVDEDEKISTLEAGADDFIIKPYSPRELLARIRVILRRSASAKYDLNTAITADNKKRRYSYFGEWKLDRLRRRVIGSTGNEVSLSSREYTLLLAFLDAPQRPLSRETLIQWTRVHEDVSDRSIDVTVLRLRRKFQLFSSSTNVIKTEWGAGYIFLLAVTHESR
ncbi:two-component system OmpR family response regulator [Methylobacterium sp. OAE515]|uniref:winged helix-turn-helix domain-containing protein n=1 Tax=Methylobacterium sp. OAE515 TaxID=2817895 RepID=UPI00178980CC